MPKTALATIAAWAEPPRILPVKAVEIVIKLWPAPVRSKTAPKIRKIKTLSATSPVVRPNTPSKEYQTICIKSLIFTPKCSNNPGNQGPEKPKIIKTIAIITSDHPQDLNVKIIKDIIPRSPARTLEFVAI